MLQIARGARHDWRGDFAIDILAVVQPERYQAETEIGRRAIQTYEEDINLSAFHAKTAVKELGLSIFGFSFTGLNRQRFGK